MKYTLLEMVQDVLSSMDSDEVNSITDTTESMQVARVVRACYFDVVSNNLPEDTFIFQMEPSNEFSKPVLMYLPQDIHNLVVLKYNRVEAGETDPNFTVLTPLSVDEFFKRTHALHLSEDNVASMEHSVGGNTFTFLYQTDKGPSYYTSVDGRTFFFDSYDQGVDGTLQKVKTFCIGQKENVFNLTDNYVIDLNEKEHIWLLNEAKSLAFAELKQVQHPKAEQTAKRQRIKAQAGKHVMNDPYLAYQKFPNYGRAGRNTPYSTPLKLH